MNPLVSEQERRLLRLCVIRKELRNRLWPVNRDMPNASFEVMIDNMAQSQYRSERYVINEPL